MTVHHTCPSCGHRSEREELRRSVYIGQHDRWLPGAAARQAAAAADPPVGHPQPDAGALAQL